MKQLIKTVLAIGALFYAAEVLKNEAGRMFEETITPLLPTPPWKQPAPAEDVEAEQPEPEPETTPAGPLLAEACERFHGGEPCEPGRNHPGDLRHASSPA